MSTIEKKEYYTTSEIAKVLHVAVGSVINWVDNNEINAIVTPGGHRKIPYKELIKFLKSYNYDIPETLLTSKLIILIDDEESIHFFFKEVFKNSSEFELECFDSGTEALMFIGKRTPEIIVVDIVMPDVDGIQVIKNIKNMGSLKNVKIIAISGDNTKKGIALEAGADVFLKKPFEITVLKDIIANLE